MNKDGFYTNDKQLSIGGMPCGLPISTVLHTRYRYHSAANVAHPMKCHIKKLTLQVFSVSLLQCQKALEKDIYKRRTIRCLQVTRLPFLPGRKPTSGSWRCEGLRRP